MVQQIHRTFCVCWVLRRWPVTFKKDTFDEYMKWFEPLADLIKHSKTAGHGHERSITFFCLMYKHIPILTQGFIKHLQMNSHGTQDHYVDYDKNIKELIEN